jgi:hypothetical protein
MLELGFVGDRHPMGNLIEATQGVIGSHQAAPPLTPLDAPGSFAAWRAGTC